MQKAFSDPLFGNVFYIHTGALQIELSEESDQGKYECVATNSAGTRYSAPANLYVRGRNDITLATTVRSGSGIRYSQDLYSYHCNNQNAMVNVSIVKLILKCRGKAWGILFF